MTPFIQVNLARGMQRVMPGLFTPAGMNPPYAGTIDRDNSLDHLAFEADYV